MNALPTNPNESFRRRNPHLYGDSLEVVSHVGDKIFLHGKEIPGIAGVPVERPKRQPKPLLNATEERCLVILEGRGLGPIFKQAFTLRLDPPFCRYTPDLAFLMNGCLNFVEVKGLHRFRRAGIAKAALAAKTYPLFKFWLHEWDGKEWKQSLLTP